MGCQRNSLARSICSTLSFCFQRSWVLKFTFKTCLLVPSLQCSWLRTRHETLNPIKICTEVLPVLLNAMRKMATIKAFRLFFFLFMAFPFYLLPIFENKSELLKLVRITWKGDCKIFEMAVVRGKDNTLSETNHNYHQVWDRIFSFVTWSIDVNCLFVFFGTKRFLGVFWKLIAFSH